MLQEEVSQIMSLSFNRLIWTKSANHIFHHQNQYYGVSKTRQCGLVYLRIAEDFSQKTFRSYTTHQLPGGKVLPSTRVVSEGEVLS